MFIEIFLIATFAAILVYGICHLLTVVSTAYFEGLYEPSDGEEGKE